MISAEQYEYCCCLGRTVKAYKKMTRQKAEAFNQELEKRGACGRWVSTAETLPARHSGNLSLPKAA